MKIEHVALFTENLEKMRDFYVKYFNAVSNGGYRNPKTRLRTYFLSFGEGSRLEIMSRPDVRDRPRNGLGYVHLAFSTGSRDKVDNLAERLQKDGYRVLSGPRMTGDGYYECLVLDPDGNEVEITE